MYIERLKKLPPAVQSVIFSDRNAEIITDLTKRYSLTEAQTVFLTDLFIQIVVGDKQILELSKHIAKMPDANLNDVEGLARDFAIMKLWSLQDYFKNVDVLITRLGGRVPEPIPLPLVATDEASEWEHGEAREMLLKNRQYTEYYLTQKPIRDPDGRLKAPNVTNWLADYLHVMGAGSADALKRSQYVAKSPNASKLNDPEKRNLLNFLISYETAAPMYWLVAEGNYLVVEPDLPETERKTREQEQSAQQMSELLEYYADIQRNYLQLFEVQKSALDAEVSGNLKKLADRIWDALGVQQAEQCLTAIDLLIDRHALWDVLKTDQRFRGIVSRFIDARYGTEAKTFWNGDITTAIGLAFFWRIVCIEKLGMPEDRAAIISDYFSKRLGQKIGPMYLDLRTGKFIFRDIAYKDRQFNFV